MTDRDSTEFATGDSREGAIQRILNRVIDARHAGDRCADDQIIREHPELLPELAERLQQLGQVQAARALADDDQTVPMLEGQLPLGLLADKIGAGSDLSAINADLAADPGEENHYRVLERLGKGGFGTVYKAEQRHPMRRVVAIKMITAGVDTPEVVARFESERQALARMDHPHIAKVFDAGSTRSGRPYFVMEYVPGEPITQFADRHKLTIAARLALFQQVCEAVNHAHMKSVIHRDIKAGNVLAYMHDGRPAAKVIDFGIAKALTGDRLTNQTFNTFHGQVIGTYESMSPEQAGGSPDVDTRTDVYSLGVLLYELLSGFKPLDSKMLFKAADAEIRRIICEVEPERPSTRLTSVGDAGSKIAAARQASIATLTQQFRRELEWIPLKAMRKERDRRYASPLQLAEDIRNYSEGKPLIAGPESGAYRFRKLLFRHKGAATALAGIAAALMIGVLLMLVGLSAARSSAANARISASKETAARLMAVQSAQDAGRQRDEATRQKGEAERQRDQATKQERIATQVNDFLSTMLASADPDKLLGDKVTVLQATDAAVKQLDAGTLNDQPLVESAIRTTMGRTLWALGRFDQAEPNLRKAVEISRKSLPPGHPDIATSLDNLASLLWAQGKYGEAERLSREALEIRRKALSAGHPAITQSLNDLALVLRDLGKYSEAEPLFREALAIYRKALPAGHRAIATSLNNLASLLCDQGEYGEAEPLYREALAIDRKALPAGHPDVALSLNNLANLLMSQGKYAEAEPLHREALEIDRKALPTGHPVIAQNLNNLANVLRNQGKYAEAEPLHREALEIRRNALPAGHPDIALSLNNLATLLTYQGKYAEAEPLFREALAIYRKALPAGHPAVAMSLYGLAVVLMDRGKYSEAEPLFREALEIRKKKLGAGAAATLKTAGALAGLLDRTARGDEAAALRKEFRLASSSTRPATGPVSQPNYFLEQ